MAKITANFFEGPDEQRRCSMSGRLFDQEKGLEFSQGGEPVDPSLAQKMGYEIAEINPPLKVRDVTSLIAWITNDLGLKRTDSKYYEFFGRYHDLYKTEKTLK